MKIEKNTIVSLRYKLSDAQNLSLIHISEPTR
ncbi:MAG: peptidylprolyl isomerase, partial [Burkholderiaceae bacterium]|nr:peptidylprolyl isomerase [Burkholderiaceae bacterium]